MKAVTFLSRLCTSLLIANMLTASARADTGSEITDEELLMARNPLIIKSRVRLANEYTDAGGGNSRDKLVLGAVYGFGFNEHDRNFGIGFQLPFLYNDPAVGGSDSGVGDFKIRGGQLIAEDPQGWRAGWFFDVEFDTAADAVRAIANQRTQMSVGIGAGHAVFSNLFLTSTVQYGWSFDDGETTGAKREWEAHLTATTKVSDAVSLNLDYKAVIKTVGNSKLFNTLEPSIGWTVGESKRIGLFASCELPLYQSGADWIAKCGMLWFY